MGSCITVWRVKKGFMGYRKSIEKAEASGPSENEGMRFECEDGVYEIREGKRCWVELSDVKRAHLELSEGYVN